MFPLPKIIVDSCLSNDVFTIILEAIFRDVLNVLKRKVKWPVTLSSISGIPAHIDTHSAFEDEIISLSLGSEVNFQTLLLAISKCLTLCNALFIGFLTFLISDELRVKNEV